MNDAAPAPAEPSGVPIEQAPSTPNPAESSNPAAKPDEVQKGQPPKGEDRKSIDDILKDADAKVKAKGEEKPEPKKSEKTETKADTKPADEKAQQKPDPNPEKAAATAERSPDGKFKAKEAPEAEPAKPRQSAHPEAPQRFDEAAKAEWEAVGENTRGAVHRTIRELESGIERYKADAESFEAVRKYDEMAKESGTDLKSALDRYTGMEDALRRDPIAGLEAVIATLGLKGPNGQPATLRDVAAFVLNQKPDQLASRQEATINGLRSELASLKQQLGSVTDQVTTQANEARNNALAREWQTFTAANPNAVNLEGQMAEFLNKYPAAANVPVQERLADALAWAEARNPQTPVAAQTRDDVAAQTRDTPDANPAGQKSVSGAPASGSDPALPAKPKGQIPSIDDALNRARARVAS